MTDFEVSKEARDALALVIYKSDWPEPDERIPGHLRGEYVMNADAVLAAGWVPAAEYRDHRITELTDEMHARELHHFESEELLAAALAVIEKAPHDEECRYGNAVTVGLERDLPGRFPCTCWKSSVDTSALVERDAEKDRRITELEATNARWSEWNTRFDEQRLAALAVIEKARAALSWRTVTGNASAYNALSLVDTSALTERDAERLREIAHRVPDDMHDPRHFADWLRALAEKGAKHPCFYGCRHPNHEPLGGGLAGVPDSER